MSLLTGLSLADLSRQRRTMQAELTNKVNALEEEVSRLKKELGKPVEIFFFPLKSYMTTKSCQSALACSAQCREELSRERRARELAEQEKESALADLQHELDNMEADYEKILHVSCSAA